MINFRVLDDSQLIIDTLNNERIYKAITDDFSPKKLEQIEFSPRVFFLGAYYDNDYCGLFVFDIHNVILYEVHTCLLPKVWGVSVEFTLAVREWIFTNTDCQRIITNVPESNKLALRLAKNSGFTQYGFNPSSIQKDNVLLGQYLLGVSKCQPSHL